MSVVDTADATAPTQPTPPTAGSRRRPNRVAAFGRLVRSEFSLIAGRRRNQVGLLILAAVPILLGITVWYNAPDPGQGGPAFFADITLNGIFVALTSLTVEMPLFLPLAVAALSGDAIAGEAGAGTLRYVLTVPVGRSRLLLAKYLAALLGVLLGVLVIVGTGVLIGLVLFGAGPVLTLSGIELSYGQALLRVLGAALYATGVLAAVLAIGVLISCLTEAPIAAMIAVVVVTMAMQILGALEQLSWLHPYLITQYWTAFADFFREPVFTETMAKGLSLAGAYVVVGLGLALWRFRTRDISC
ncbi:ABC transporter permease [Gephyromycinifex aptenodytis]|uniref:ABC transporter permease n=1 Tax=Gephyromycinifex aptenodytis TaxID=2716227 RepID=UPI001446485F|nr:ABC transporter permease subunit [Gephyromycinifex aptenodytis]